MLQTNMNELHEFLWIFVLNEWWFDEFMKNVFYIFCCCFSEGLKLGNIAKNQLIVYKKNNKKLVRKKYLRKFKNLF